MFKSSVSAPKTWDQTCARVLDTVKNLLSDTPDLTALMKCELCQKSYEEPKILPECSHTFCKKCLLRRKMDEEAVSCPKCHHSILENIEELPANEIIEQVVIRTVSNSSQTSAKADLKDWFDENEFPQDFQSSLLEQGFISLDAVLALRENEIDRLNMKPGHKKELYRAIEKKREKKPLSDCFDREAIRTSKTYTELLYDSQERSLTWGTLPSDILKLWQNSLGGFSYNSIKQAIKVKAGVDKADIGLSDEEKIGRLQRAAMVLCDAGCFEEAESHVKFCLDIVADPSKRYNLKVLLIYATHWKLRLPMWMMPFIGSGDYTKLLEECDDVTNNGKEFVSKEKLCKVYILKAFNCERMIRKNFLSKGSYHEKGKLALKEALELSKDNAGLRAEAKLVQGLLEGAHSGKLGGVSLEFLKESWRLCDKAYGEYNVLMATIYYFIGVDHDKRRERDISYECFRRAWLIERQIRGAHHPMTKKYAKWLTEFFKKKAKALGDSLPDDDNGGVEGPSDREYRKRISFY